MLKRRVMGEVPIEGALEGVLQVVLGILSRAFKAAFGHFTGRSAGHAEALSAGDPSHNLSNLSYPEFTPFILHSSVPPMSSDLARSQLSKR
ncbi:MAG: hypothetical protein KM312_00280 [Hydrogenibacillus schlegelii]|uniref:Uncharacterized protein n=1 Tax=Hydrogenibacillus schlegelii TaxID=1484 RepID=A0A947G759_HYDSH|nr:hypothetical protein [Hydrogenibacillus schlegelii]